MKDFIATDQDGNVTGKWRRHNPPSLPDNYEIQEVDDVSDYSVDYWYDKQS